ncbi:hypothetical protein Pcinc_041326 [Petrolisthes cinctipes]|uniref:Uncharacterized protein n=1 Tax=Petrolisthes cinctipes TaxID=88211 RepID=A0AAE1EJX5_PETCI|nr:hypothetical protein Pcinc_041326 [Petrolisthes cinctipes]
MINRQTDPNGRKRQEKTDRQRNTYKNSLYKQTVIATRKEQTNKHIQQTGRHINKETERHTARQRGTKAGQQQEQQPQQQQQPQPVGQKQRSSNQARKWHPTNFLIPRLQSSSSTPPRPQPPTPTNLSHVKR